MKNFLIKSSSITILLWIFLTSCSSHPAKYGTTLDKIKPELKQAFNPDKIRPLTKVPHSIANLLIPKINNIELADANDNNQIDKKFNIVADNTPAKSFFLELVDGTPINVVVHPDVVGNISLSLKNVNVNDVLEAVQKIYGFGFESSQQSIKILPVSLQTRVFKLNYLDLVRTGNSGTNISAVNFASAGSSSSSTSSSSSSSSSSSTASGSNIATTNTTNLWDQLLKTIQSMLGIVTGPDAATTIDKSSIGKSVAVSPMTGMIIVTAYPNELQKIENFLAIAEHSLNKQVMLEAKVLEVDLNDGYRSGINWALINDHIRISQIGDNLNSDENLSTNTIVNSVSAQQGGVTGNSINTGTNHHTAPQIPTNLNSFGGLLTLGMNYRKLATFVELLAAQGNVQVLSSPRITTSNNQKALIKVGNDQFFITNFTTTTTSTATSQSSAPTVTLNPFFSGIALDVTPQIGDEDITLHIHPTISTVTSTNTKFPGAGTDGIDLAKSSVRESDSIVRAKNGQLIVIGGLMQDKTAELITGIPFLKDIPFVGAVFRHTRQQAAKSELVILLRPTILDDYKIKHQLQNTYKRINDLDHGFHVGGGSGWYGNLGESP